jgi:hypothetical protein
METLENKNQSTQVESTQNQNKIENKTFIIQNISKKIYSISSLKKDREDDDINLMPGMTIELTQYGIDSEEKIASNRELYFMIANGDAKILDKMPKMPEMQFKKITDEQEFNMEMERILDDVIISNPTSSALTMTENIIDSDKDKYSKEFIEKAEKKLKDIERGKVR